jgi:hypothetical protein
METDRYMIFFFGGEGREEDTCEHLFSILFSNGRRKPFILVPREQKVKMSPQSSVCKPKITKRDAFPDRFRNVS